MIEGLSPVAAGALASLAAGGATGLGALPILGVGRRAARWSGIMLGFAAGVMLAASFFSLIVPAIDIFERQGVSRWPAASTVALGLLAGGGLMLLLGRLSLDRFTARDGIDRTGHRIWMLVAAITLHNAPEGMAVGVSFAQDAGGQGYATALGIGIQNIPEGLAVASALAPAGWSTARRPGMTTSTSLCFSPARTTRSRSTITNSTPRRRSGAP